MTARDDYDRAADLASQAREVVADWRALMVAAGNDALVPAYRAMEAAQNLLDDESARLHVAVRVEPTDADRERVVREVQERMAKAVERKPSAGWVCESAEWERYRLTAGGHIARVWRSSDDGVRLRVDDGAVQFDLPSILAAQFAAEDALLEIASVIVGAVRK